MTDNSSNQRPMFANMKEGSAESNIFAGYPVPLQFFPPQTPFMYPFSVLPNMWLPNVDDLVMGQRVSELGPSFVGLPSAVIGQIDCDHMTRVTPLRKESVIVTAKPGGGVVPITLNPNLSATCINGNMQGGFSAQEKGNDCISRNRAESDEVTANLVTGQNAVESLTPKQRYSRSDTGQSAQGFAELDVAQILVNDMPVPFLSQSKADSTTAQEHTFVKTSSPTLPLPVMEREESMPLAIAQETFVNDSDSHSHLNFQQEQGTKSTENNVFINEDVDKSCSPLSPKETVLSDSTNLCLEDTVPVVQQDEPDEDNSTVEVTMIPNTANLLEEEIYDNYQESILVNKPGSSINDDDVKSNQEMSDARYDDDLDHNEIDTDDCEKNKDSNENVADQENKSSLKQTQSDTNGIIADVDSACSHNTSVSAVSESHLLVTESGNREEAAEVTDLEMNIINDRDNNGSSSNDEEMKETNEKPMEECQEVACTSKMAYKCEVCCQLFRSPVGLQKHLEFHTDKVQHHTCTTCFERFDSVASLEEHGKTHQKKRPHKCGFCPKAFRDPGSLQKHVRVHTGEKPYKCTSCFRSFAEYSSLRKHLRVHTGEQPYKCTFCSKAFSISGNLQRHILIHTGERPYKCTFCPKAFNNPSHLRRHVKNLHYKSEGKGCHLFGGKELNLDAMTDGDIKDSSGSAMNGSAVSMDSEPVTPSDDGVPTHVDMLLNQVSESVSK